MLIVTNTYLLIGQGNLVLKAGKMEPPSSAETSIHPFHTTTDSSRRMKYHEILTLGILGYWQH